MQHPDSHMDYVLAFCLQPKGFKQAGHLSTLFITFLTEVQNIKPVLYCIIFVNYMRMSAVRNANIRTTPSGCIQREVCGMWCVKIQVSWSGSTFPSVFQWHVILCALWIFSPAQMTRLSRYTFTRVLISGSLFLGGLTKRVQQHDDVNALRPIDVKPTKSSLVQFMTCCLIGFGPCAASMITHC